MKQVVKCKDCGTIRTINRHSNTPKEYSFWCSECKKEVAQDLDFQEQKQEEWLDKLDSEIMDWYSAANHYITNQLNKELEKLIPPNKKKK